MMAEENKNVRRELALYKAMANISVGTFNKWKNVNPWRVLMKKTTRAKPLETQRRQVYSVQQEVARLSVEWKETQAIAVR